MTTRKLLTDKAVRALKPAPAGKRYVYDTLIPNLLIRTTSTGHKTFVLRAKFPGKKGRVRKELGEFGRLSCDDARTKARRWLSSLAEGAAVAGGLYYAYPVQVSTIGGLTRNFIITLWLPCPGCHPLARGHQARDVVRSHLKSRLRQRARLLKSSNHGRAQTEYAGERTRQGTGRCAQANGQALRRETAKAESFTTNAKRTPDGALRQ